MKLLNIATVLLIICFASCKEKSYKIEDTAVTGGKSQASFIEGILTGIENNTEDTLLYYKFNLLDTLFLLKESPGLNIGLTFLNQKRNPGTGQAIGIIFSAVSEGNKREKLKITNDSRFFTIQNYNYSDGNKSMQIDFGITADSVPNPATCEMFTTTERMKEFLRLFNTEIRNSLQDKKDLKYSGTTHANGYFQTIDMKVKYD